ncbi:hypothetical protein L4X63_22290 [Geomonas sp. Red32]|uniref:hypothetical protein n=1 Tax=Geomonas sp. Red32 TaxID=2912856 RepID=UPI00202CD364|nr:hypothetical protein [Geomonas sp. Red32]MCM0084319.1 hypothetical protein [Geomonas sp. Red32]
MNAAHSISYFFGGLFLANAIPHTVSGLMGRAFQSPFAKPSGKGLSSSTVNVLWGWFNVGLGYALTLHVGHFDVRSLADVAPFGLGGILISLFSARHFGEFHGGNSPNSSPTHD